jgi:hypothetical protein
MSRQKLNIDPDTVRKAERELSKIKESYDAQYQS